MSVPKIAVIRWRAVAFGAVLAASVFAAAAAGPPRLSQIHSGIRLIAVPLKPGASYDINIVEPQSGLDNLRRAIDMLTGHSPLNAAAIATLKKAGEITIVYNPNFPERTVGAFTVAAFSRKAFHGSRRGGGRRSFLVIVGRQGIQWTTPELAAILAHELAGHGLQHQRGEAGHMRSLDRECEAHLYEEKAFQDLKVDKKSRLVVQFRKELENHACVGFKSYMAKNARDVFRTWDDLNPDIRRLLTVFRAYLKSRR